MEIREVFRNHDEHLDQWLKKRSPLEQFVTLLHVFGLLDITTLKQLRQVSRLWNDVVVHVFNRRGLTIHLGGPDPLKPFKSLQHYLDFVKQKSPCLSDLVYSKAVVHIPDEPGLFIDLLEQRYAATIQELDLRNLTVLECNCILEKLVESLPRLTKLRIMAYKGQAHVAFQRFGDTLVNQGEGSSTSKLKNFCLYIAQDEDDEEDQFQEGDLLLDWGFVHLCPHLEDFCFQFQMHETLQQVLTDFQESCPKQKISKVVFAKYDNFATCPTPEQISSLVDFVNFYRIENVSLKFATSSEKLIPFFSNIDMSVHLRSVYFSVIFLKNANRKNYEQFSELVSAITSYNLPELEELTFQVQAWYPTADLTKRDRSPRLSFPTKTDSLQKLDFYCRNSNISAPYWDPPEIVYWFYQTIPEAFPNLVEFVGRQNNDDELKQLLIALGGLKKLEKLSLTKACNCKFQTHDIFFGGGSKGRRYKGLGALRRLHKLTVINYSDDFDSIASFADLPTLKLLRITAPEVTEANTGQRWIDELEGRIAVQWI